jgi:hypothetical protein
VTVLSFAAPCRLLSLNDRMHWSNRARAVKLWRNAAYYAACQLGGPSARAMPPSTVTTTFPCRTVRRRDPHNYIATMKPIIDGLVDAGCWPDDTFEYVTVADPVLYIGNGLVVVSLTSKESS